MSDPVLLFTVQYSKKIYKKNIKIFTVLGIITNIFNLNNYSQYKS